MNDNEPPLWDYQYRYILYICFVLLLLFLMGSLVLAQKPLRRANRGQITLSECFLEPIAPHYVPYVETYGALIDKLVECESGGNPEALGDQGRAHGILQFHQPTFQQFCVDRYGFTDNIWDEETQKNCCAEMLSNGLEGHWTCSFKI